MVAIPPTVDDLLDYLALTGANYPLEQAQEALDAASEMQADMCVMDPYEPPLREAALRRAARLLVGRGAPLGVSDQAQYGAGAVPLLRWDAHIEELEREYRRGGFA